MSLTSRRLQRHQGPPHAHDLRWRGSWRGAGARWPSHLLSRRYCPPGVFRQFVFMLCSSCGVLVSSTRPLAMVWGFSHRRAQSAPAASTWMLAGRLRGGHSEAAYPGTGGRGITWRAMGVVRHVQFGIASSLPRCSCAAPWSRPARPTTTGGGDVMSFLVGRWLAAARPGAIGRGGRRLGATSADGGTVLRGGADGRVAARQPAAGGSGAAKLPLGADADTVAALG